MQVLPTGLDGVLLVEPKRFADDRGWFTESWRRSTFDNAGINTDWVQDNHSFSAQKNTLRGLHYQKPPHAQAKLIRCTHGAIWDVAVDYRAGSPTYLHHVAYELSAGNMHQLYVPEGFLHGFVTLQPHSEVQYKCSAYYAPDCDAGIRWDDPDIAIEWPVEGAPNLSGKDAAAPFVADCSSPF